MTELTERAAEIKACCAALYASDWTRLLVGDALHPGGLALTARLGELLGLGPGQLVLDVACGTGASAVFLAQRFGCEVAGVDYGAEAVAEAHRRAERAGLAGKVRFEQGDAEHLATASGVCDALICECAFCTFPDKWAAAAEFARVLRPGGRLGLADLTRRGPLGSELQTLLAWLACLGDARPIEEYCHCLCAAGFGEPVIETHDTALAALAESIEAKLEMAGLLARAGKLPLALGSVEEAKRLARAAAEAIHQGRLGYSLLVAVRL